jgi:hypothetical protein
MSKPYRTKDLQLASYLLASGFEKYEPIKEGNIVYFEFEQGNKYIPNDTFCLENNYWKNEGLIEPKKLFNAYNELRLRIRNMNL